MVRLLCAIVGMAGITFEVTIDNGKSVSDLKKATKTKSDGLITAPYPTLKLFLAKKNEGHGPWLTEAEAKKGVSDTTGLKLLGSVKPKIGDVGLSTADVELHVTAQRVADLKSPVHVLVVVPEGTGDAESESSAMHRTILTKRNIYGHSQMNATEGVELLQSLGIHVEEVKPVSFPVDTNSEVEPFEWGSVENDINSAEVKQNKPYMSYVECNIGDVLSEENFCVFDVEKSHGILSMKIPGHFDTELSGRADLLILDNIVKKMPHALPFLPGLRLLIEVKQELKDSALFQGLLELSALDFHANNLVMVLVTDLNNNWNFFWVSEKEGMVNSASVDSPGDGFRVIRALLKQPRNADSTRTPTKRQKVA